MLPIPPFAEVALLDRLPLPADADLKRELLAAVVAAVVTLGLLPRGRRRLAAWPVVLLLLAPLPSTGSNTTATRPTSAGWWRSTGGPRR